MFFEHDKIETMRAPRVALDAAPAVRGVLNEHMRGCGSSLDLRQ